MDHRLLSGHVTRDPDDMPPVNASHMAAFRAMDRLHALKNARRSIQDHGPIDGADRVLHNPWTLSWALQTEILRKGLIGETRETYPVCRCGCGKALAYPGAMYAGAACCARYEGRAR